MPSSRSQIAWTFASDVSSRTNAGTTDRARSKNGVTASLRCPASDRQESEETRQVILAGLNGSKPIPPGGTAEGSQATQTFIQHAPEGEDVAPAILEMASHMLGAHISGGSRDLTPNPGDRHTLVAPEEDRVGVTSHRDRERGLALRDAGAPVVHVGQQRSGGPFTRSGRWHLAQSEAEVEDLHDPLGGQEDVVWLEVAMDDPAAGEMLLVTTRTQDVQG